MWWCNDCEQYFDEPEYVREHHSELNGMGGNTYEEFAVCPICHDYDIEECKDKCDACGEIVRETSIVGRFDLCPDCMAKLSELLNATADKIVGELDIDRLDAEMLISDFFEEG